jgi:hypothetical protein
MRRNRNGRPCAPAQRMHARNGRMRRRLSRRFRPWRFARCRYRRTRTANACHGCRPCHVRPRHALRVSAPVRTRAARWLAACVSLVRNGRTRMVCANVSGNAGRSRGDPSPLWGMGRDRRTPNDPRALSGPNADAIAYEYLKAPADAPDGLRAWRDCGVDVTASFAADRATACADAFAAVRAGFRLAVPVAIAKRDPLPSRVLISHNGATLALPAIDGDRSDARWLDPSPCAVIAAREARTRRRSRTCRAFHLPDAPYVRLLDGAVQLMRDA